MLYIYEEETLIIRMKFLLEQIVFWSFLLELMGLLFYN